MTKIYKKNANKKKHKKNDKETLRNFLKNIRYLRSVYSIIRPFLKFSLWKEDNSSPRHVINAYMFI